MRGKVLIFLLGASLLFTTTALGQKSEIADQAAVPTSVGSVVQDKRVFSGVVVTNRFEFVPDVLISVEGAAGRVETKTDSEGRFSIPVPSGNVEVKVSGSNIETKTLFYGAADDLSKVRIRIDYIVPQVSESVTIVSDSLSPTLETRNAAVLRNTLISRDDQLVFTLNAGINAGQHEGGGKSLEIRRYGFNTDHGGVNGGVKILVDNVQQNQGTQGHGQGYLGSLKSLSPELVDKVTVINGPFSAGYGDFSGLGVVLIDQRQSLKDTFTARIQGGSFSTLRSFVAFSPKINKLESFLAYEFARTDGPFESPLGYARNNITGNLTYDATDTRTFGARLNVGTNRYRSSGQIPLDLVFDGSLDRFGFIDPDNGGFVESGTVAGYYRESFDSGTTIRADAFVTRSLFDLYSNFTFFLADPVYGDEIQQHDSRLIEGANLQVFVPYKIAGTRSVLTAGADMLLNQVNVGLYPTVDRNPNRKFLPGNSNNPDVLLTRANADISNFAGYLQNSFTLLNGHLLVEAGLRWDYFSYGLEGVEISDVERRLDGSVSDYKFQPKLSLSWSPFETAPFSLYANYGRGITSQDARGVIRNPDAPRISTTDFYQFGSSYNSSRFSGVFTGFLIDRSNEQVYIPDDGTIEFADPTRSYGFELRGSARLTKNIAINGGLTQVLESYFRDTQPREFVDSAPHRVANAGIVFADWKGLNVFTNWRHISSYRLDGFDDSIRASGHDVVDISATKRLNRWVDFNVSVDNLFNKRYYETQNLFESRVTPTAPIIERIHATPGYSTTVTFGLTLRFGDKD